ncbi:hypothetical protein QF035_006641 [Streptomyces umbrinus]|uniref:DUF397 domain-containing protein n=1 Tax=Streptomyces umbrinus TaxID=67370 RepID=A0ABU0SZT1_9ACTN|nr:DUF397 domain-containing protein [Streptomyces umbrinus]MDQ1029059.1 hypothetical protein [Streptomyces umbrinus]
MTKTEPTWQKSTHSEEASSCVYVATPSPGTILLRESDDPESVLTTGAPQLAALISTLRTSHKPPLP